MDDEDAELRNPFPSPPSHYLNYTTHNLKLLALLRERASSDELDLTNVNQHAVLSDQSDIPDWPLSQLEKPRVDWVLEDGQYTVFGDTWMIKENIPSLAELGGHQLYAADSGSDRRPTLLSILRSMLVTYSKLMNALLAPPQSDAAPETPAEWQRYVEWITILSQNIMAAANDLRPVQARMNLELMMKRQVELRKQETTALHLKCDELEAKLVELRASAAQSATKPEESQVDTVVSEPAQIVTMDDVLKWSEEIT